MTRDSLRSTQHVASLSVAKFVKWNAGASVDACCWEQIGTDPLTVADFWWVDTTGSALIFLFLSVFSSSSTELELRDKFSISTCWIYRNGMGYSHPAGDDLFIVAAVSLVLTRALSSNFSSVMFRSWSVTSSSVPSWISSSTAVKETCGAVMASSVSGISKNWNGTEKQIEQVTSSQITFSYGNQQVWIVRRCSF